MGKMSGMAVCLLAAPVLAGMADADAHSINK